jgi:hypothetical protein
VAAPAALAPPAFSASEVALVFGLIFTIAVIWVVDTARPPAVSLAGAVPLVGGPLASAVDNGFTAVRNLLQVWLSTQLQAFSTLLSWLQTLWSQLSATVAGFAELTYAAAHKITYLTLPAAVSSVLGVVGSTASSLLADILSAMAVLRAETRAAVSGATAAASALYSQASAYSLGLFNLAEADAAAGVALAETNAGALFAQAEAVALAEVQTVTAYVDTKFSQSIAIGAAAEAALGGQLNGVAAQLGADLNAGVSALEQQIAAARAALTGSQTIAIAAVATDIAAIRAMRCMQVCDPLGAVGEGLNLLDLALIFALVEQSPGAMQAIGTFLSNDVAPVAGAVL